MFEQNDPAGSNFNVGHAIVGIIKPMGKFQAHRMRDGDQARNEMSID